MTDVKRQPGQPRRERAKATRRRIIDSAYRLFCAHGYPATTMEAIATRAGIAVQTVYYVFGSKPQLLRDVTEAVAAGEFETDPPIDQGTWMQRVLTEPDGHRALALATEHSGDLLARVAALHDILKAAAAVDSDIDAYRQSITQRREAGMRAIIESLAAHDQLQPGLTVSRAMDIAIAIGGPEVFLSLTRDAHWTLPEFKAWSFRTMSHQLLAATTPPPQVTEDLSYHGHLHP
jgi:AcrR family transcriptional regulator